MFPEKEEKKRSCDVVKITTIGVVCLLLFAGGMSGLISVRAAGPTITVQSPIILSGSATTAKEPAVQTSSNGQYVYVAWTEGSSGIYFTSSANGGVSFSSPVKISQKGGTTQFPVMDTGDGYQSPYSGDVYVAWAQTVSGTLQIFVASSTNNGATFSLKQVSSGGGITPVLAASGSYVYVTWFQTTPCPATALNPLNSTTGTGQDACIYVDSSTNNGTTWSQPVELNPSTKGEAQVVAWGNYAYMTADGTYFSSYGVTTSNWNGSGTSPTGWTEPLQLYSFYSYDPSSPSTSCQAFPPPTGCLISFGREPWIAANNLTIYVTWEAVNLSSTTALYSDYGVTSTNGGLTWYPGTCNNVTCPDENITSYPPEITNPTQQSQFLVTGNAADVWEPENAAFNNTAVMTVHSLKNQGIYVTSTTTDGASWTAPVEVNIGLKGTSAYAHIFTSDGNDVWVLWGQATSGSVWDAYVAYSSNSGVTFTAPVDISNNAAGVAAGNQDVTLFWVSSIGTSCYAVYTYTNGATSQVWFSLITA